MREPEFITDDSRCSVCGRFPAERISLLRYSGLLFLRPARIDQPFCRTHGQAAASEYLRRTLLEGWWGLFGFVRNWFAITSCTRGLRAAKRLGPPTGERDERYTRPLPSELEAAVNETPDERENRARVTRTVWLALGIGVLGLFAVPIAVDLSRTSVARTLDLSLLATMFVYASVGSVVVYRLAAGHVRLDAGNGGIGPAIAGVLIGGAAGVAMAGLLSVLNGSTTSDQRLLVVLAEGGTGTVAVMVFIVVLAAPFVEEVLFRGMLVGSLRSRGRSPAVFAAAVAFSVWHLNPAGLRYYVLMGFLLGFIFWRWGLAGSVGAHLAFNGVLVLFAFAAFATPGVVTGATGVSVDLPRGWHEVDEGEALLFEVDLAAESIVGAAFVVQSTEVPGLGTIGGPAPLPGIEDLPPGATGAQTTTVSGAPAVRFAVVEEGVETDIVLVAWRERGYSITMIDAGSESAGRELEAMLASIALPAT